MLHPLNWWLKMVLNNLFYCVFCIFTLNFCEVNCICCHLKEKRSSENLLITLRRKSQFVAACCSGYHYWTTSFSKAWTYVLRKFKSCLRRVRDLRWSGSLAMGPARNKAKHLSLVNNTIKSIRQRFQCSSNYVSGTQKEQCEVDFVCKVSIN